ncbi:uncharacterized protein ACHE_20328S [Aspergillus chevalieri]|uniref:Uncharacterized protein n=1 Tax=Aspergillus chevalieri TaxID=182096 RepID=A0A7R7VHK7_ASPCH|nr:uncharacterized protein ACHE_20328S [Aspergillus chevalieri]BCR84870.1 hypothetical protein ACHE_20328S [Aspergillus chevalieri]
MPPSSSLSWRKWPTKSSHPASSAQDMRTETFFYNSARRQGKITGPPVLQIAGVNTTFSYGGLAKLGKEGLQGLAFRDGQFHSMVEIIHGEDLKTRGNEHFGFKDGIAQPQLEGLNDPRANTRKKSFRSTPPGVIITGRGRGHNEPDWAKDGSYMASRKLRHFFLEFKDFLQRETSRLGYAPEQLGTRLVGRWESGAEKDDFHFTKNDQSECPFAAHIRKARP